MGYVKDMISNLENFEKNFEGKIDRKTFWLTTLFSFLCFSIILSLFTLFSSYCFPILIGNNFLWTAGVIFSFFLTSLLIIILFSYFTIIIRRINDAEFPLWTLSFILVPGLGHILLLVILCCEKDGKIKEEIKRIKQKKNKR